MSDFHNSIYLKYKDNPEVSILALSTEPQLQTMKFLLGVETTDMPIAYDALDVADPHYNMWESRTSISPFPLDVIIDKDGNIVSVLREYEPAKIISEVNGLLGVRTVREIDGLNREQLKLHISHRTLMTSIEVGNLNTNDGFTLFRSNGIRINPISADKGVFLFPRLTQGVYLFQAGKTSGKMFITQ